MWNFILGFSIGVIAGVFIIGFMLGSDDRND